MNFANADVPLSFEVTFDSPALDVAMSVYDDSGLTPVLVAGPDAMLSVVGNTYRGKFTPVLGKSYIIFKAVYTDGSFTTLHPEYAQSSESVVCNSAVLKTGQIEVKKNQALNSFMFLMLDAGNQNPVTGLTPTAKRSLDGAAMAACANAVSEVGNGFYKINLDASDLNAKVIALLFQATGALDNAITIVTQD